YCSGSRLFWAMHINANLVLGNDFVGVAKVDEELRHERPLGEQKGQQHCLFPPALAILKNITCQIMYEPCANYRLSRVSPHAAPRSRPGRTGFMRSNMTATALSF